MMPFVQTGRAALVPELTPVLDNVLLHCKFVCYHAFMSIPGSSAQWLEPAFNYVEGYGKCPYRAVSELPPGSIPDISCC